MEINVARDLSVREASHADLPGITRMLADAFQDDPVMSFIFPDPEVRRARLPRERLLLHDGQWRGSHHLARAIVNGGVSMAHGISSLLAK